MFFGLLICLWLVIDVMGLVCDVIVFLLVEVFEVMEVVS